MKRLILPLAAFVLSLASAGAEAEPSGEQIYQQVCQTCHAEEMTHAEARAADDMLGPPMNLMVSHLRARLNDDRQAFVDHVVDFTLSPSRDRALVRDRGIERFGLMPPLKTIAPQLDRDDLRAVAQWLWQRYDAKSQTHRQRRGQRHRAAGAGRDRRAD